ncbi:DUF4411 family protein [Streptomyces sp. NPDC049879]|uniref:DUF4411 family protein n=1 Tax=Streptomyces sp. NPDC049879 TaxID=3365598 RepID=UPI0037B8A40F
MYLVDSNVLIEAKNRYYAFDIAPGFWVWLDHAHENALACSIAPVREELVLGGDELATWAQDHPGFFRPVDSAATTQFGPLTSWAHSGNFTPSALNDFIGNTADFYLIAYAKAHNHILVTHEQSKPDARRRIMIPDACMAMGVRYANTFAMLRSVNARLSLQLP